MGKPNIDNILEEFAAIYKRLETLETWLPSSLGPRLFTIRQFSDSHPAFSQQSLRNLIFFSKPRKLTKNGVHTTVAANGMIQAGVIVRIGRSSQSKRKLMIDEQKFFDWLRNQQENE